jgi:hypothetical protein
VAPALDLEQVEGEQADRERGEPEPEGRGQRVVRDDADERAHEADDQAADEDERSSR